MNYVLKEFEDAMLGAWHPANTRPTEPNTVWRIRPANASPEFEKRYSHWDGERWGRAYKAGEEVLSASDGGYTDNQDREWAGLAERPVVRTEISGRVAVLASGDPAMIGRIVDLRELVGTDHYSAAFEATWGSAVGLFLRNDCSPVFRTEGPVPEEIQALIDDAIVDKAESLLEANQQARVEEDEDPL